MDSWSRGMILALGARDLVLESSTIDGSENRGMHLRVASVDVGVVVAFVSSLVCCVFIRPMSFSFGCFSVHKSVARSEYVSGWEIKRGRSLP